MSLSTATNSTWTALGSPLSACCRPRVRISTKRAVPAKSAPAAPRNPAVPVSSRTRGLAGAVEDIRIVTEGTEQTAGQHLAFGFCREAPRVLVVGNREGFFALDAASGKTTGLFTSKSAKRSRWTCEATLGA